LIDNYFYKIIGKKLKKLFTVIIYFVIFIYYNSKII